MRAKPLIGRTILVTRPESPDGALEKRLRALGARVVCAPVIRIAPPSSYAGLDAALRGLGRYDAAAFASARAVESVFARARALGLGRLKAPPKVFAVGPQTALALRRRGWPATAPKDYRAQALATIMRGVKGRRIFLPRAQEGGKLLARELRGRGAAVDAVAAYRTLPDRGGLPVIRRLARAGRIDAVAFTSGSAVEQLMSLLPAALRHGLFRKAMAASIGPVTSAALRRWRPDTVVEARRATAASLSLAIARHFRRD